MMPIFLKILTYLILFVFPTLANLVEHAGSSVLAVLALFGIYAWLIRKTAAGFDSSQKILLSSFAAYFLIPLIFYAGHSFFKEHFSLNWEIRHLELRHEIRFLGFIPIYYLFYKIGLKRWVLWFGASAAAIISGVYGVLYMYGLSGSLFHSQGISEIQRASGAYHAIAFGDISLMMGFISLSGIRYFSEKNKLLTIVPLAAVASGMLACFLSGTRIAALAIPLLTLIFFIQLGSFRRPFLYRSSIILVIALMSVAFYFMPKSPLEYRIRAGIHDAKAFFNGHPSGDYAVHLSMWVEGWKIFAAHPVLGVGINGYENIIIQKAAARQIPPEIGKFYSPHNMYLMNMTAYGICGLFILLGIFFSPLLILIPATRKPSPARDIAYAGLMLIFALMLFGVTECIFIRNINISVYIILLAAIVILTKQFQRESASAQ